MEPLDRAQEILLCDLCLTAALQSHCELCQINLCKACVVEHLSDSSERHNVVPYKHKTSAPNYQKCPNHTQKHCELYCEKCDIPVCSTCISSDEHHGHKLTDILQNPRFIKEILMMDFKELENRIYPTYEKIEANLNSEKLNMVKHYKKLTTAVTKKGEDWHRKINSIVNKQKSEIDEMKSKHLAVLNKQENEIKQMLSDVKQTLFNLKKILDSNDVSVASTYKSRNAEFRKLPPKFSISLPSFSPHQINTDQLRQMFGSLSSFFVTTDEHGYTMKTPEAVSSTSIKPLLDKPEILTNINTGYEFLRKVTCLSDDEIWTRGEDRIMKLYNMHGQLLDTIQTKSENHPRDIAVTSSGDLVYTDPDTRTVNIVKNKQIQEVINLRGWEPNYISDREASAVVVVNQTGKLRFRYTGHPSTTKESFYPIGITTDSQSHILTADSLNHCVHILDQDGQFLCYIDNCDLQYPWGLCVDTRDNLLVAECNSGQVKKIKYM
ncbi:E3 ubiquitin-protein ligase TRIM36-like [Saccostrea cucullata]|uniref:E3 ubiquitin-protein ligase TRIM36-like n=1 Tax=Saccostrea cuccullata TaxID=36930 RepID=UPI002ED2D380